MFLPVQVMSSTWGTGSWRCSTCPVTLVAASASTTAKISYFSLETWCTMATWSTGCPTVMSEITSAAVSAWWDWSTVNRYQWNHLLLQSSSASNNIGVPRTWTVHIKPLFLFVFQVDQVLPGHYNTFGAKRLHRLASSYISRAATCPGKFSTFAWRTLAGVVLRASNPGSAC